MTEDQSRAASVSGLGWSPPSYLSESQLIEFRKYVNGEPSRKGKLGLGGRPDYHEIRPLFKNDPSFETDLIQLATAYVAFEQPPLHKKLKKINGYSRKGFEMLRGRILRLAAKIDELNKLPLPGGATAPDVIFELGREDVASYLPGTESNDEFVLDIQRLPYLLSQFAATLKGWPHPNYRKEFSARNWKARPLAQLCAFVRAVHGTANLESIATLVDVTKEFVTELEKRQLRRRGRQRLHGADYRRFQLLPSP
jgi:hypothetical protein